VSNSSIDFQECVDIFRTVVDHMTDSIDSAMAEASPQMKHSMALLVACAISELARGRGQLDGMPDCTAEQLEHLGSVIGALVAGEQHVAHCPSGHDCPSYRAHEELRNTTPPEVVEAIKGYVPREFMPKPIGNA